MPHFRLAALSLGAGLFLSGCGGSQSTTTGSFTDLNSQSLAAQNVNRLEIVDSTPNAPDDQPLVQVRAFDSQGNVVYGPIERPYNPDLTFLGVPSTAAEVQVDAERAPGFVTRSSRARINFLAGTSQVVRLDSAALASSNPSHETSFTVKVVNNSAYPDDKVFISVSGKDRDDTAFYYLKFNQDGSAQSLPFGTRSRSAEYSTALTGLLKEEAPHTYSFICPTQNLVSGRMYISFGKKLEGYGLVDGGGPKDLVTPSASGAPDYQTLYEFMEMSATIPPPGKGPQEYTLFTNTSVVDFFSIGLGMQLAFQSNSAQETVKTVGFQEGARDGILRQLADASTPAVFQRYIMNKENTKILRVLAPNQSVAIDGENSPIGQFLNSALDSGWLHYAGVALNIPDTIGSHSYGYQFTGVPIAADQLLNMTLAARPAGDTASPIGEQYSLSKPTSKIVFFCDDVLNNRPVNNTYANLGSDAHKRLVSFIGAALNRGVFENYNDWGNSNLFYTRADGKYNWYAKIMHQFAIDGKVYGFGYDDIYGQDPTLVAPVKDVNRVVITIPPVEKLTSD
ncbi:hypothetical protein JST97_13155 [bacterium]|nr:hypothetical protein [bacterium]